MLYSFLFGNPRKPLLFYKIIYFIRSEYKIMTLAQPKKNQSDYIYF